MAVVVSIVVFVFVVVLVVVLVTESMITLNYFTPPNVVPWGGGLPRK